jgi:predicted DNA-binding protein (UPF0251 family)
LSRIEHHRDLRYFFRLTFEMAEELGRLHAGLAVAEDDPQQQWARSIAAFWHFWCRSPVHERMSPLQDVLQEATATRAECFERGGIVARSASAAVWKMADNCSGVIAPYLNGKDVSAACRPDGEPPAPAEVTEDHVRESLKRLVEQFRARQLGAPLEPGEQWRPPAELTGEGLRRCRELLWERERLKDYQLEVFLEGVNRDFDKMSWARPWPPQPLATGDRPPQQAVKSGFATAALPAHRPSGGPKYDPDGPPLGPMIDTGPDVEIVEPVATPEAFGPWCAKYRARLQALRAAIDAQETIFPIEYGIVPELVRQCHLNLSSFDVKEAEIPEDFGFHKTRSVDADHFICWCTHPHTLRQDVYDKLQDVERFLGWVAGEVLRRLDQKQLVPPKKNAGQATPKRRRPTESKRVHELTAPQLEAVQIVGEHKGNFAAAARAMGKSRAAVKKLYDKALNKVGKKNLQKILTQGLPTDRRGQSLVQAPEEDGNDD